jgi:hypothetical protein
MSNPLYKNGTAAQIGDVIAVNTSGFKSQYLVVALAPIIDNRLGSVYGTPPADPEQCAVVVPYDELSRCNLNLSKFAVLWSDFQANGNLLG